MKAGRSDTRRVQRRVWVGEGTPTIRDQGMICKRGDDADQRPCVPELQVSNG
jgi:hypothetical protein